MVSRNSSVETFAAVFALLAKAAVILFLPQSATCNPGNAFSLPASGSQLFHSINGTNSAWFLLHVSSEQAVGVAVQFNHSQGFLQMRGYLGCNSTVCGSATFTSTLAVNSGWGWNSMSVAVPATQAVHVEVFLSGQPVASNSSALTFSISSFHQGSGPRAPLVQSGIPYPGNISLYGGYQTYRIMVPTGQLTGNLTILGPAEMTDRVFGHIFPEEDCNEAKPFCDGPLTTVLSSTGAGSHVDSEYILGRNRLYIFRLWALKYGISPGSSVPFTLTLTTSSNGGSPPGSPTGTPPGPDNSPSSSPKLDSPSESSGLSSGTIAGIVVGSVAGVAAVIIGALLHVKKRNIRRTGSSAESDVVGSHRAVTVGAA